MDIQFVTTSKCLATSDQEPIKLVHNLILAALLECCSHEEFGHLRNTSMLAYVTRQVFEDLMTFAGKDPAASGDPMLIAKTYTSFAAVLHYRLANWVYINSRIYLASFEQCLAAIISRRGKLLSGAEINYRCHIGARFIIDHGVGTVIGETSIIGDDCYLLGGVTLGARGISSNPSVQRHPKIGNRVQIGAFASVLGFIDIGDDVLIGPGCIVTQDIPPGARVQVKTSLQVVLRK